MRLARAIAPKAVLLLPLLGLAAPAQAQQADAAAPRLAPPPPANPDLALPPSELDYPARARKEGRTGITYVLLITDADGAITNCAVHRSSGHADLDEAACRAALRRLTIPAEYINGTPRQYLQPVQWKLKSP